MTSYRYRFNSILSVREQEKQEMEASFKQAVSQFEEVATKLYEALKRKEEAINEQNAQMATGFSIEHMHRYSRYIEGLEKTIDALQLDVAQARTKMNWHEQKLLEKSLEVRKYEKMRERDFAQFQEEELHAEAVLLDELSSLSFHNKKNR